VTGSEFLRRLAKLAKRNGLTSSYHGGPGKGSHGRVFYGDRFTTLKDPKKELGKGLLKNMCSQLDIELGDL
jgi:hypothetical protein